jgi:hypothetical protein
MRVPQAMVSQGAHYSHYSLYLYSYH